MELVYLWVKKYKNIDSQGFNFSPKFTCKYDEDSNEVTIDKNDDYIKNFFGDNINVTAIVGKNGSGKSSLLELIIDFSDGFDKAYKALYIIEEDNNLVIYRNNIASELKCKDSIAQNEFKRSSSNKANRRYRLNYAYFSLSPFLNNMDYLYRGIIDKKYFASIYNYRDDYDNKTFNYIDFYLRMIPKIPDLLKQKHIQKVFSVKGSPQYLAFKFNKYIQSYLDKNFFEIEEYVKKIHESEKKYTYELSLTDSKGFKTLERLIADHQLKKNELEKEKTELETKLKKDESKGLLPEPAKSRKTEFDKMNDELYKIPYEDSYDEESMQSKFNRATNMRIGSNRKKIEKIEEKIEKLGIIEFNLTISENGEETFYFSSGELVLLFYVEKLINLSQKEENIILLIDENELFLHPDWQKKFLLFLTDLFSHSKYKRQIIISSHSPFLISDIPKENIIFLQDGKIDKGIEDSQTFGANIHTLLSDSFFMEGSLMGEFAKDKIEDLINFLKPKGKDKETKIQNYLEAEKLIAIIGEPVLQMRLEKMLENYKIEKQIETEDDVQKQITELEQKLIKMRNGKDKPTT